MTSAPPRVGVAFAFAAALGACAGGSDRMRAPSASPDPAPLARDAGADAAPDASTTRAEAPEIPLEIEATLLPGEEALDVRFELALGWIGPRGGTPRESWPGIHGVTLTFVNDLDFSTGRGFAQFVSVVGDDGGRSALPAALPVTNGRLSVRYRVELRHHRSQPARGLDEVPHPTRGGWFLAGRAFIPTHIRLDDGRALDVAARLHLRAPAGWSVVGSPDRLGDAFHAGSFRRLANAMYATGDVQSTEVHVGNVSATVVTGDFDATVLARIADVVRRTLSEGHTLLGPLPETRVFIDYDRNPVGIDGGLVGRAISVLTAVPPDGRGRDDAAIVTVHELMHLWNRADAWWINEGLTRYLEVLVSLRLDRGDDDAALDAILPVVATYEAQARGATIAASTGSWGYAAGAVAMLCADTHLRERHADATILSVHRAARTEGVAPGDGNTVTAASFLAALDAVSPSTGESLRAIVDQAGPIDVAACFRRAGFALTRRRYRGLTDEALETRVLGITSRSRYDTRIFSVREGSMLAAGRSIVAIDGRAVRSFADVDWELRRARSGQRVRITTRAGDALSDVTSTIPALAAADRVERLRYVARRVRTTRAWPFATSEPAEPARRARSR